MRVKVSWRNYRWDRNEYQLEIVCDRLIEVYSKRTQTPVHHCAGWLRLCEGVTHLAAEQLQTTLQSVQHSDLAATRQQLDTTTTGSGADDIVRRLREQTITDRTKTLQCLCTAKALWRSLTLYMHYINHMLY